jgi:hypothetical protein
MKRFYLLTAGIFLFLGMHYPVLSQQRLAIQGKCIWYGAALPAVVQTYPLDAKTRNWLTKSMPEELSGEVVLLGAEVPQPVAVRSGDRPYLLCPPAGPDDRNRQSTYFGLFLHNLAHVLLDHKLNGLPEQEAEEQEADRAFGRFMALLEMSGGEAFQLAERSVNKDDSSLDPDRRLGEIMTQWETNRHPPEASPLNETANGQDKDGALLEDGLPGIRIPVFPLPPPKPSATYVLPRLYLEEARQLGEVDYLLSNAMAECGYIEKSYFAVPKGYAMVTLMEQMDPNTAAPLPPPDRWDQEVGELESFSLGRYLKALVFGHTGSFRVFVFVVTPVAFTASGRTATRAEAETWLSEGLNKLPVGIRRLPFTPEHSCTVLIYEFEKKEGEDPRFVERSSFSSRTHLERARILEALARP